MDEIREKSVFDGRIDASAKEIQDVVDFFLFENFQIPGIDFRVEYENQKQVWVIYPSQESTNSTKKIINGFVEISAESLSHDRPVTVRLVSCRQILDLLFFQLSQRIQAKFIVRDYPPDILTTPWKDLIAQGLISPLSTTIDDVLFDRISNPKGKVPKYGTDGDLTEEDVIRIVSRCRSFQERGGTIKMYYESLAESVRKKFGFETLRTWLKKFSPPQKLPRNLTR